MKEVSNPDLKGSLLEENPIDFVEVDHVGRGGGWKSRLQKRGACAPPKAGNSELTHIDSGCHTGSTSDWSLDLDCPILCPSVTGGHFNFFFKILFVYF